MPVTVVVRSASSAAGKGSAKGGEGDDAPSLTFDGARIVVGRGTGSDVRLPDPSVSFRHATIRATGPDYAIVDEGSTNGTFVGGVRLAPQTPRIVKTGDLVRVGRVWLEIAIGQRPATPDLNLATRDLAFALVQRAMDAVGDDTTAKVRVAEGPDIGEEMFLVEEGRAYVIGRAEGCDLPLADADASREHAAVTRRGAQVLLRDLGSRNGVWLGDQRLTPDRDVPWRPPTMARIGLTVLALDEPVSVALAALEAAEDEAMREEDVPAAPASVASVTGAGAAGRGAGPSSKTGAGTGAGTGTGTGAGTGTGEEEEAGPASEMSEMGVAAPIAEVAELPRRSVAPKKRAWTMTDVLVVTLALSVIGASIAGLIWVLK